MNNIRKTMKLRMTAVLIDALIVALSSAAIYLILSLLDAAVWVYILSISLFVLLYPLFFELLPMTATPGMHLFGLYITFAKGKRHGLSIFIRWLLAIITCIPLGIGFWYGFFEKNERTLYDVLSGSAAYIHTEKMTKSHMPCVWAKRSNGKYECYVLSNDRILIGRNPQMCTVLYPPDTAGVSRCHCSVTYNEQTNLFILEDLCSSNGTFLKNGYRLEEGKVITLSPDDKFYLGKKQNECIVGFTA